MDSSAQITQEEYQRGLQVWLDLGFTWIDEITVLCGLVPRFQGLFQELKIEATWFVFDGYGQTRSIPMPVRTRYVYPVMNIDLDPGDCIPHPGFVLVEVCSWARKRYLDIQISLDQEDLWALAMRAKVIAAEEKNWVEGSSQPAWWLPGYPEDVFDFTRAYDREGGLPEACQKLSKHGKVSIDEAWEVYLWGKHNPSEGVDEVPFGHQELTGFGSLPEPVIEWEENQALVNELLEFTRRTLQRLPFQKE